MALVSRGTCCSNSNSNSARLRNDGRHVRWHGRYVRHGHVWNGRMSLTCTHAKGCERRFQIRDEL
eukprot:6377065-Amphidinium_carterae.1